MPAPLDRPPLFIALDPTDAAALEPPTRVSWACAADAGVVAPEEFEAARRAIARLSAGHAVFLRDPLFDAPRLADLFADGETAAPEGRDWLLALAPFGQARNFAAILETARERAADPDNAALVLLEAFNEAARRAGQTPAR